MSLTSLPFSRRFDLPDYVGQRQATFRFQLINGTTGENLGYVTPLSGSTPMLSHDVTRNIKRDVSLQFGSDDTARINPVSDRIRIWMDFSNGDSYPLGRYMFVSHPKIRRYLTGDLSSASLVDEMFILDQPITDGFTAWSQEDGQQTIQRALAYLPINTQIETTPFSSVGSWTAGTTTAKIITDIVEVCDYMLPWFDNDGVFRIIRTFNPQDRIPDFNLDVGNAVLRDSIAPDDNLLVAANRIVVISNNTDSEDTAKAPIVGTYNFPMSAPHSAYNRGFVIADVRNLPVQNPIQAAVVAKSIALRETVFESVELSTVPDPRHDSYNIVRWDDKIWLETGWSMELIEGGSMKLSLRKVYS